MPIQSGGITVRIQQFLDILCPTIWGKENILHMTVIMYAYIPGVLLSVHSIYLIELQALTERQDENLFFDWSHKRVSESRDTTAVF